MTAWGWGGDVFPAVKSRSPIESRRVLSLFLIPYFY